MHKAAKLLFLLSFTLVNSCLASFSFNANDCPSTGKYVNRSRPIQEEESLSSFRTLSRKPDVSSFQPFGEDLWQLLANDVIIHIFDSLTFPSLKTSQKVCRRWLKLSRGPQLSYSQQILRHSAYVLLEKTEGWQSEKERLFAEIKSFLHEPQHRDRFFNSPDAVRKALWIPCLRYPAVIERVFESEWTSFQLATFCDFRPLEEEEKRALEAYTYKLLQAYSLRVGIEFTKFLTDPEFPHFTQHFAGCFKALSFLQYLRPPLSSNVFLSTVSSSRLFYSTFLAAVYNVLNRENSKDIFQEREKIMRDEEATYFYKGLTGIDLPYALKNLATFTCHFRSQMRGHECTANDELTQTLSNLARMLYCQAEELCKAPSFK